MEQDQKEKAPGLEGVRVIAKALVEWKQTAGQGVSEEGNARSDMARPCIARRVGHRYEATLFKPAGIRGVDLDVVSVHVDELEAVRLKDALGLSQEGSARKMDVSQPTFHRLLSQARRKIAQALVHGKGLRIEGGNVVYAGKFNENRDIHDIRG